MDRRFEKGGGGRKKKKRKKKEKDARRRRGRIRVIRNAVQMDCAVEGLP